MRARPPEQRAGGFEFDIKNSQGFSLPQLFHEFFLLKISGKNPRKARIYHIEINLLMRDSLTHLRWRKNSVETIRQNRFP